MRHADRKNSAGAREIGPAGCENGPVVGENEPATGEDQPAMRVVHRPSSVAPQIAAEEAEDDGPESHRRRLRILKTLFETREVTVELFASDPQFKRSFSAHSDSTLKEDFRFIEDLLNQNGIQVVTREGAQKLQVAPPSGAGFINRGYKIDLDEQDKDTQAKRRIGEYIATRLLGKNEVLYLSTGTTVFQVAYGILVCREPKVSVILTDNLGIIDLFRQQERFVEGRQHSTSLVILGGEADFHTGDIVAGRELTQLAQWRCTKTIMSCTFLNPETGQIFSFHQPEVKELVLNEINVAELIIPVHPDKIEPAAGGKLIPFPTDKPLRKIVVTTELDDKKCNALDRHKFEIHRVDQGGFWKSTT